MSWAEEQGKRRMATRSVSINRAPVLTLWAAVVAQRLGFDEDEALTLGKVLAGLNAQAKGRRLGIFKPHEEKAKKAREKERGERFWIEVLGRPVPATNTEDGIRAVRGSKPIDPDTVQRCRLQRAAITRPPAGACGSTTPCTFHFRATTYAGQECPSRTATAEPSRCTSLRAAESCRCAYSGSRCRCWSRSGRCLEARRSRKGPVYPLDKRRVHA